LLPGVGGAGRVEAKDARADFLVDQSRLIFVTRAVGLHPGETGARAVAIDDAGLRTVEIEHVRERETRVKIAGQQLPTLQRFD
jgi:hypothetical protein